MRRSNLKPVFPAMPEISHTYVLTCVLACISFSSTGLQAQVRQGRIEGQVVDSRTQEVLAGANIVVLPLTGVGASADPNGFFAISAIPVGEYSLKVSLVGYQTQVVTNVVVSTGRSVKVKIPLVEAPVELEGSSVTADYFRRGGTISPISTSVIDAAEVKRSPGSLHDIQRVVQVLPGIGNSTDNTNELIVRGGSPSENLTIMDYVEIPSINHYANQFNSAGPINMVNADLVEDIQFSSGGFPAQYGDKMSSIMRITLREGDRQSRITSNTGLNFAGINTLLEGGINEGRGSWIFSARRSFLEVLDKIIGMSALSLTAIPKYWDAQGKVVYDLSPSQKLIINGLYGYSTIDIKGDFDKEDDVRRSVVDSSSLMTVGNTNVQYAAGMSLKNLWGKQGYSVLTLSTIGSWYRVNVRDYFTARVFDGTGQVTSYSILATRPYFANDSYESFYGLKYELSYQIHPQHELSLGAQVQIPARWDNTVHVASDTSRFDLNGDGLFEVPSVTFTGFNFDRSVGFAKEAKWYVYASDRFAFTPDLALTVGLRYDYFSYSRFGSVSPRMNLTYRLPSATTCSFSYGDYYQIPPFPYFGDNLDIGINRFLKNAHSRHAVLGIEQILADGLRLSVEGYYKKYDNLVVSEEFIHSADPTFRSDRNLNVGRKHSYGVELFLQQKQVHDYYGTASLSLSRSVDDDPRLPPLGSTYRDEYDYPVIAVLSVGKITKGARSWLNETPFFLRYPSYVLPISDDMEISFRFRYQTGKPYTPKTFVRWKQVREGGVQWSRGAWVDDGERVNASRYADYHRLDLQWISRFHFESWSLHVYITLQNVYNRKNVWGDMYRSDGTMERVYQLSFFPVGGVEVLF